MGRRVSERLALFRVRDIVTAADSPYSSTERLVALCIADFMGPAGSSWPSRGVIEEWTGLGHSAVSKALRTLCGDGGLFELRRGGARPGNRYESNVYELSTTRPPQRLGAVHDAAPSQELSCPPGGRELSATRSRAVRYAALNDTGNGSGKGTTNNKTTSRPSSGPLDGLVDELDEATTFSTAVKVRR